MVRLQNTYSNFYRENPNKSTTWGVIARSCCRNQFLRIRISWKTGPSPLLHRNFGTTCLTMWGMQSLQKASRKTWRPICFKSFTKVSNLLIHALMSSLLELALYKSLIYYYYYYIIQTHSSWLAFEQHEHLRSTLLWHKLSSELQQHCPMFCEFWGFPS